MDKNSLLNGIIWIANVCRPIYHLKLSHQLLRLNLLTKIWDVSVYPDSWKYKV